MEIQLNTKIASAALVSALSPQLRSLVFFVFAFALPAKADWIEHEMSDPFEDNFTYTIRADEVVEDTQFGYAPTGIFLRCMNGHLFTAIEFQGEIASPEVRYRFDDRDLIEAYWTKTVHSPLIFPSGISDGFSTQALLDAYDVESLEHLFLSQLAESKSLTFQIIGGMGHAGGYAVFNNLSPPYDEFWADVHSCL